MKRGVVLFGHGSRNPAWAEPFQALRKEIARQQPDTLVELGFLELMEPGLPDAIGRLVAAGAQDIVVVPIFISAGNHVREDLPQLLAAAMERHPGLKVRVVPALGEAPEMLAAMAHYALQTADQEG
jgi:sirohydrochlorin cobaltochelatase